LTNRKTKLRLKRKNIEAKKKFKSREKKNEEQKSELKKGQIALRVYKERAENSERIAANARGDPWPIEFQEELQNWWPNRYDSRYQKQKALLVRWESDDLEVSDEIKQLSRELTRRNFKVLIYLIPDENPSFCLEKKVREILRDSPDTLFIFYYTGHGGREPKGHNLTWFA
jgi:hypothetical protein